MSQDACSHLQEAQLAAQAGRWPEAAAAASAATSCGCCPEMLKSDAFACIGEALCQLGQCTAAWSACASGAALLANRPHKRDALYRNLQDRIAMQAAACGNLLGFNSRVLEVRPASYDEAWLGLPAPPDRLLDALTYPEEAISDDVLLLEAGGGASSFEGGAEDVAAAAVSAVQRINVAAAAGQVLSFRCAMNVLRCCSLLR